MLYFTSNAELRFGSIRHAGSLYLAIALPHRRPGLKHARKRKIMVDNPTEDLKARSKQRVCERYLTVDECRRLLSVLVGRDHLIVRMFIQLGLRPEEMFALRRDGVQEDRLRIDEALVEGQSAPWWGNVLEMLHLEGAGDEAWLATAVELRTDLSPHAAKLRDDAPTAQNRARMLFRSSVSPLIAAL